MVWFDVPQLPVPHQSGVLSHAPCACACALLPAALCGVLNLAAQCPGPVYLPSFLDHPSPTFFFFSSFIALEAHRTLPYRFSVRNPQIPLKVLLLPYRIAVFFRPLLSTPYLNQASQINMSCCCSPILVFWKWHACHFLYWFFLVSWMQPCVADATVVTIAVAIEPPCDKKNVLLLLSDLDFLKMTSMSLFLFFLFWYCTYFTRSPLLNSTI